MGKTWNVLWAVQVKTYLHAIILKCFGLIYDMFPSECRFCSYHVSLCDNLFGDMYNAGI